MPVAPRTPGAGALLSTRFGRRIFMLFCLAAVLPSLAVFWMTYRTSADSAADAAQAELRAHNKAFALGVFQRLETAREVLAASDAAAGPAPRPDRHMRAFFDRVAVPGDGTALSRDLQRAAVADRSEVVVLPSGRTDGADVVLLGPRTASGRPGLAARLRKDYLWGKPDEMGQLAHVCAQSGALVLFCGGASLEAGGKRMRDRWSLFLKPVFGADEWSFVAESRRPEPLSGHEEIVVPILVGVLLLVILLSSIHIRRVMGPLAALLSRIRAFGGGAGSPLPATRGDEFDVLTHTFEDMGNRIALQMGTLRTMSSVDRLILERGALAGVILLVLQRARDMVGGSTVALVIASPRPGDGSELHLLGRHAEEVETVVLDGGMHWPAASAPDAGGMPVGDLSPSPLRERLEQGGDAFVTVIALGVAKGHLSLLLGSALPAELAPLVRGQLLDLAERVAVALAFQAHQARLVHQARHDLLTGLPNRLATFEALATAIGAASAGRMRFAVVFLDLDRFKAINDGVGHAFGDDVLVQSGLRIRETLAPGDFVGRFGGDEFFVILPHASTGAIAQTAVSALLAAFERPIQVAQREVAQHFSAGIAFHPEDGQEAADLVRSADIAMYQAKRAGGAGAAFFEQSMNELAEQRLQMEDALRRAVEQGDIEVHYQPRVDSRDGRIVGVEALARWTRPGSGPVPPATFIALAEECGLVDALGRHILGVACRQAAEWRQAGFDLPVMGVNISSHQLRSGRLLDEVRGVLADCGLAPGSLELEVTETTLVEDTASGTTQLQALRGLGVKIAIDDFGTGYSSLAYLTRLPSDTLKIDRAFVVDLLRHDAATDTVVRSIIAIARDLGKDTIAEGVETAAQVAVLAQWGCHVIQGYVYARPLAAGDLTALLAAGRPLHPIA